LVLLYCVLLYRGVNNDLKIGTVRWKHLDSK